MQSIMNNIVTGLKQSMRRKSVRTTLIGLYILLILGLSASARADYTIFPQPPRPTLGMQNQLQNFSGEVAVDEDGRVYLVTTDEMTYELRSSVQDLAVFNGQNVEVIGYEVKYKVGPVYQFQSVIPLQIDEEKLPVAPVLVVYNVSIIQ